MDLFITQTVLQYLCLKKHVVAALAFSTYTAVHPSKLKSIKNDFGGKKREEYLSGSMEYFTALLSYKCLLCFDIVQ